MNVEPPLGYTKATNPIGRSDSNEASDGDLTFGEHDLFTRMQALKQLRDRTSLFHFDRAHLPSVAA